MTATAKPIGFISKALPINPIAVPANFKAPANFKTLPTAKSGNITPKA